MSDKRNRSGANDELIPVSEPMVTIRGKGEETPTEDGTVVSQSEPVASTKLTKSKDQQQ